MALESTSLLLLFFFFFNMPIPASDSARLLFKRLLTHNHKNKMRLIQMDAAAES